MAEAMSSEALAVRAEFETWDGAPGPKRHFAAAFVDVDALCAHVVELRKRPVATPEIGRVVEASLRLDSLRLGHTPEGMSSMEWFLSKAPEYQSAVDEHIAACRALHAALDTARAAGGAHEPQG